MRNKITRIIISFTWLAAMIGTAAALNLGIDGGGLVSIAPGETKTLDLTASGFNPDALDTHHTLSPMAVQCSETNTPPFNASCRADLVTVTVNTPTFTPDNDPFSLKGAVTINNDANNTDPVGTKYIIYLQVDSRKTGGFAVASAFNIAIDGPGIVQLKPGDSITLDLTASAINPVDFGTEFSLDVFTVECSKLNTPPRDISCNSQGVLTNISINTPTFTPNGSTVKLPGAITITMPAGPLADPPGTQYIISAVSGSGASGGFAIASLDAINISITEFPTIIAPVAAIGLFYFFMNKRRKEGE